MTTIAMQVLRDLPESSKLYLRGQINEKNANKFLTMFNKKCNSERPISLSISSSGGSTRETLYIYRAVKVSMCPVYGIVRKEASSGGLMILQACTTRIAVVDAEFSLHPNYYAIPFRIFALMDEERQVEEYRDAVRTLRPSLEYEWENTIAPIYESVEKAGRSKKDFAQLLVSLPTLNAYQALEWGLVDEVVRRL